MNFEISFVCVVILEKQMYYEHQSTAKETVLNYKVMNGLYYYITEYYSSGLSKA